VTTKAIETRYAGCRFRSRLEARWAVFFNALDIPWQYEPQGFLIGGVRYLPDFLLTDCGTWVEVKGDEYELDHPLMLAVAERLPARRHKDGQGPRLLILGPIPEPPPQGDLGWIGIDVARITHAEVSDGDRPFNCNAYFGEPEPRFGRWECECGCMFADAAGPAPIVDFCSHLYAFYYRSQRDVITEATVQSVASDVITKDQWWGFGRYRDRMCPQIMPNTSRGTPVQDDEDVWLQPATDDYEAVGPELAAAYRAARSARFEHGESG
jgi:hypothetical protein